ncbi:glycosyltransferase family 2 protein [Candidatus Omnitrophota bacterium]
MLDKKPHISIVIPVFNGARFIAGCLEALLAQEDAQFKKDYEIIVVDDGSLDGTAEEVKKYPVRLIQLEHNAGKIHARRLGAESAQHETILFIDMRVIASKDLLKRFWEIGYVPVLAGRQLEIEKHDMTASERLFYLIRRKYYYPYFPLGKDRESVYITKENFNRVPKGTTCLFIDKQSFLASIPRHFDRNTNDDTTLLENIVCKKNVSLLKHRDIVITYLHRTRFKELAQWVFRRGITFFDFYLSKNFIAKGMIVLMVILTWALLGYCIIHPIYCMYSLFGLILLYVIASLFLLETALDIFVVLPQLWIYLFLFSAGIVKGWSARIAVPSQR